MPDNTCAPADGRLAALPLRDNPTGTYIILLTIGLLGLGVVMVQSALASLKTPGAWYARVDTRHVVLAVLAAAVLLLGWRFDYRRLAGKGAFPWPAAILLLAALAIAVLVYVPGLGHDVGGKHRWVRVGSGSFELSLQPSELVKLSLLIFLAAWLSRPGRNVRSLATFAIGACVILLCVGAVIKEDFGTASVIAVSAAMLLLLSGVRWYYLMSLLAPVAAGAFYVFVILKPERFERLMTWQNPWGTYQTKQALFAIGSGGWQGQGLGLGLSKYGYLPEDTNDYIYSILCNELGFIGAVLLMGMLVLWLWNARNAAVRAGDRFGELLAGSLGFVIGAQALLHIAVNLAQVPPKGIGLPFVSAGGTSMVILAAAVALIVSVTSRRASTNSLIKSKE